MSEIRRFFTFFSFLSSGSNEDGKFNGKPNFFGMEFENLKYQILRIVAYTRAHISRPIGQSRGWRNFSEKSRWLQ